MNKQLKMDETVNKLKEIYPEVKCTLLHKNPLELLIAARLSAQCTDKRVNMVTPLLFSKFKNVKDFANANQKDIEKIIKPCGLYKTKAANIISMCQKIISDFSEKIPRKMNDLTLLSGIGRKTANLIRGEIYGLPAIIVDTHFIRVTHRLGFHNLRNPLKIELEMQKIIPEKESLNFCHRIVMHGRNVCKAKNPLCNNCVLSEICEYHIMYK